LFLEKEPLMMSGLALNVVGSDIGGAEGHPPTNIQYPKSNIRSFPLRSGQNRSS
jgi:hypothetical protein